MDQLQFQNAQLSDSSWIAQFQLKHALEVEHLTLNASTVLRGVEQVFRMPDVGFYITAKYGSETPVGCALVLKEWSEWRATWVWWIHSVYVSLEYRGQRTFEKMYALIKAKAQAEGAAGLRLYVDKRNLAAQHIYKKLGMSNEHYELFEELF